MFGRLPPLPRRILGVFVVFTVMGAVPARANEVVLEELLPHTSLMSRKMPCDQLVGTLQTNLPQRSYTPRNPQLLAQEQVIGAEAALQLAILSFTGDCRLRRDEGPLRSLAARGDARGVAALRVLTAKSPLERATAQVRPEDLPLLERMPKPKEEAVTTGPITRKCTSGNAVPRAGGEPSSTRSPSPPNVLAYWGISHLGNGALCQGQSPDPQTRAFFYDWPHVVSTWQAAAGRQQTGELAGGDVDDLYRRIDVAAAEIGRERRDLQLAEARLAQQQQAAINERVQREAADEREFRSFLSKSANPQRIYLQAGKYERAAEPARAKQLYEFIVGSFPATPCAVSSNDRLLQMRSEELAREAAAANRAAAAANQNTPRRGSCPGGTKGYCTIVFCVDDVQDFHPSVRPQQLAACRAMCDRNCL